MRYAYPYSDDPRYSGVHIQNDEYLVKMFYLSPVLAKPGQQVMQGQAIGTAQKISTKYGSGMIDHVHVEVWPNGTNKTIDSAPLFGLGCRPSRSTKAVIHQNRIHGFRQPRVENSKNHKRFRPS